PAPADREGGLGGEAQGQAGRQAEGRRPAALEVTEEQLRLFVAIDPPPAIAASIEKVLAPARRLAPDEKWSSLSKLHLTLVFLGHLPASTVEPIGAALSRAAARAAAFDAQVRGAGTFGRGSRARVLWLGVDGGDALVRLQA